MVVLQSHLSSLKLSFEISLKHRLKILETSKVEVSFGMAISRKNKKDSDDLEVKLCTATFFFSVSGCHRSG